jgi:hypothetical protein
MTFLLLDGRNNSNNNNSSNNSNSKNVACFSSLAHFQPGPILNWVIYYPGAKTLTITTLGILKFNIMTISIKPYFVKQHK